MPRSHRKKELILSRVKPKDKQHKNEIVERMAVSVLEMPRVFVVHFKRPNNNILKELRISLGTNSRIFFAYNNAMKYCLAQLGEKGELLAKLIRNHSALLATSLTLEQVEQKLRESQQSAFAEAGEVVDNDIVVPEGPLNSDFFSGSMEPHLRDLGLPTALKEEKIVVLTNYCICKAGDTINNAQARLLKHFGYQMSSFQIEPVGYYSSEHKDVFLLKDELASWLD